MRRRDAPSGAAARRGQGEQGAYLVLYALLAVSVFTMAALVLDMTSLRQDKRAAGMAADLAVTAGAVLLDPASPSSVASACEQAWAYFRANTSDDTGTLVAPPCSNFTTFPACDPTVARTVSGSAGPYEVEITNPVPEGSPLMRAEAGPGDTAQPSSPLDGLPCERLAVRIVRTRPLAFAGVVGVESGQIDVHAVARPTNATLRVPSLVVTDSTGCRTLVSSGDGELRAGGGGRPGIVFVASSGSSCPAGDFVIDPLTANAGITALPTATVPGVIHSVAVAGGSMAAYDPGDTNAGRLSPVPSPPPPRATTPTAFVTDRFNCTTAACPPASNPIGSVRTTLGTGPGAPVGYVTYDLAHFGGVPPASGSICELTAGDPSPAFAASDDVFVDCPVFSVGNSVTFPANVVFAGAVVVRNGGCLAIRDPSACGPAAVSPGDGVVYVREGNLEKEPDSDLVLSRTFVHLSAPVAPATSGGALVATPSTAGRLSWTAPELGSFANLLLWAESADPMLLGHQNTFAVEGLVYAPNTANFELRSLSGVATATIQLVAGRVELAGNRNFTLAPSAIDSRVITEQRRDVRLLR